MEDKEDFTKLCPKCEYENDIEDRICDRCGATLDTE
jgi:transposase